MSKKESVLLGIAAAVFLLSLFMIIGQNATTTGFVTESSTFSNVSIQKYLSISMSGNLSAGILFGSVSSLPATNVNASANNNSDSGKTSMFINVSTDSNTAVDFCVKANTDLTTSGGNIIGLGNETYANATTTSAALPSLANEVELTTSYVKANENVGQGNSTFYRFYLDVPASTSTGDYNNSVSFKGVSLGTACGS